MFIDYFTETVKLLTITFPVMLLNETSLFGFLGSAGARFRRRSADGGMKPFKESFCKEIRMVVDT